MASPPPDAQPNALDPQPIPRPARPHDPAVRRPRAPACPPTVSNVLNAVQYNRDVDKSFNNAFIEENCTRNDAYSAILYQHAVVSQAVAATTPQAAEPPLWFRPTVQALLNDLRDEIRRDIQEIRRDLQDMRGAIVPPLMRLVNKDYGDLYSLEVLPFRNGDDPTKDPHNLPHLYSARAIDELEREDVIAYLNGYRMGELPEGPNQEATNRLLKNILKRVVGALRY